MSEGCEAFQFIVYQGKFTNASYASESFKLYKEIWFKIAKSMKHRQKTQDVRDLPEDYFSSVSQTFPGQERKCQQLDSKSNLPEIEW